MRSKEIQALIAYRMQRSEESLQAAEIMFQNQMLTFAMNRIYYAMFYAVQACLVLDGTGECKTIGKRARMLGLVFCSLGQRLTHASGRLMMPGPAYRLTHLGGEACVPGSCHLVQAQGLNILVDCGAVQGNDRAVAMDDRPVRLPPSTTCCSPMPISTTSAACLG